MVNPEMLREAVAEACFSEWCQQNGADCVWRGHGCDTSECWERWLAVADAAIAAVEWDNVIVERGS